jgi:hypothetical protein
VVFSVFFLTIKKIEIKSSLFLQLIVQHGGVVLYLVGKTLTHFIVPDGLGATTISALTTSATNLDPAVSEAAQRDYQVNQARAKNAAVLTVAQLEQFVQIKAKEFLGEWYLKY